MSVFPEQSAIKAVPSVEAEINAAHSVQEIQAILHSAAIAQKLIEPDPFDSEGKNYYAFRPVEPGTAPRGYAKTLVIDGQKIVLEADSPEALVQAELAKMRELFAQPAATTQEQLRKERGQFVAQPTQEEADAAAAETARQADLQLKFQLGQIDAPTFIRESHAIDSYLAEQGIAVEDLKSAVQEKQSQRLEQGWKSAVDEFLNSTAGRNWPGGEQNLETANRLISENPELMDNPDRVSVLTAVWEHMRQHGLAVVSKEIATRDAVLEATDYESLKAAVGYKDPANGGGFWGR